MCVFAFPTNLFWWTWRQYGFTMTWYVLYVLSLYCALLQNSLVPWTKGKKGLFVTRYVLADGTVMTSGHCGHSLEQEDCLIFFVCVWGMYECQSYTVRNVSLNSDVFSYSYHILHSTAFHEQSHPWSVNHLCIQQLVIVADDVFGRIFCFNECIQVSELYDNWWWYHYSNIR